MAPHRRAARAVALGAAVGVLVGCQPHPDCSYTDCGTRAGHVVGVGADGGVLWRVPASDAVAQRWQVERYETPDPSEEYGPKPVLVAGGDRVVVDGCAAVHVLDGRTGATLLETTAVARAWAVADGLLVGVAGDVVVGVPFEGDRPGWRVARPDVGGAQAPVGVVQVGDDVVVAWEESLTVVASDGGHRATSFAAPVAGPPVALDATTVLVPSPGGMVTAVNPRTGAIRWAVVPTTPDEDVETRLFRVGEDVLVAWEGGVDELARVTPDGAALWRRTARLPRIVDLTSDATTVLARLRGRSEAIDLTTGDRTWLGVEVAPHVWHSTTTGSGVVITGAGVSPATGVAWSGEGPLPVPSPWSVRGRVDGIAGRDVVVQDDTRNGVHGVDPATGDARWSIQVEHLWASTGPGYNGGPLVRAVALDGGTTVVADLPQELIVSVTCDQRGPRRTVPVLPPPDH